MNFIDIFSAFYFCVYVQVCVREVDRRHQAALLPSRINCVSLTGFQAYLGATSSSTMIILEGNPMVSVFGLNKVSAHHVYCL